MQDMPNASPVQESPDLPPAIPPQQKKSNKTWIIILVVVVVLCCLCSCIGIGSYLWTNGDSLLQQLQMQQGSLLLPLA
jgi:hypothetical protein